MSPEEILVDNQAIPIAAKRIQAAVSKSWPKFFVRLANNNAGRKSTKYRASCITRRAERLGRMGKPK